MKRAASAAFPPVDAPKCKRAKEYKTKELSAEEWAATSVQRGFSEGKEPVRVAIVGEPASGKCSVINGAVGERVLPTTFLGSAISNFRVDVEHVNKMYDPECKCDCGVFDVFLVYINGSATHCYCENADQARGYLKHFESAKPLDMVVVRTHIQSLDGAAQPVILSKFPINNVYVQMQTNVLDPIVSEGFSRVVVLSKQDDHQLASVKTFMDELSARAPMLMREHTAVYITKWDNSSWMSKSDGKYKFIQSLRALLTRRYGDKIPDISIIGKDSYSSADYLGEFWDFVDFEMEKIIPDGDDE